MSHLYGRQADVSRSDDYVVGGFAETGRQVIQKDYKSKAAEKPDFFMGGCGPIVPTGPKRKLRTSWLAAPVAAAETQRVEHVPKPHKKWTPKKKLPLRAATHDGTMSTVTSGSSESVRKGRKPLLDTTKEGDEKKEEEPKKEQPEEPAPKEKAATPKATASPLVKPAVVPAATEARAASPSKRTVPPEIKAPDSPPQKKDTSAVSSSSPKWSPGSLNIRKPLHSKDMKPKEKEEQDETDPLSKDDEIAKLQAQVEQLKADKGELAKNLKKTKGSQAKNKELKEEVFELKQQLKQASAQDSNAKNFHKLENKLNTLKMILDGKVDMNSLDDLRDHVNMLNMIINQDLKKKGMKNVWA